MGTEFLKIKEAIGDDKVLGVLITHSHVDHIGALRNFLTKRSIKIFKRSNLEEKEYEIGDRIGQIVIVKHPTIEFVESEELSETERGRGGYGSSGK